MARQANPTPYPTAMSFPSIQTDRPFIGQGFRFSYSPASTSSAYAYGYGYADAYGYQLTGGVEDIYPAYNLSGAANHNSTVSEAASAPSDSPVPAPQGPIAVNSQSKEMFEDEWEVVGCMLHDLGQDCHVCGDLPETSKTIKFGGKVEESLQEDISSASGSPFDGIAFRGNTFGGWIPGLGHPRPQSRVVVKKPNVQEISGACGTDAAMRKKNGPGHCVGCRYLWLDDYRAEQARAAGIMTTTKPRAMSGKTTSRFDWFELGYARY